jgi:hypothetical protein
MSGAAEQIARALRAGELEITRLAEGSGVVLRLSTLRSRTLNPAGMLLLAALAAGAESESELADDLIMRYDVDRATALRDAEAFLAALTALL